MMQWTLSTSRHWRKGDTLVPCLSVLRTIAWKVSMACLHHISLLLGRFYHYDCLVAPGSSIAGNFPWEKVSLLVEFEEGRSPPFPAGDPPENARLRQYIILRTVKEISASALASSGELLI